MGERPYEGLFEGELGSCDEFEDATSLPSSGLTSDNASGFFSSASRFSTAAPVSSRTLPFARSSLLPSSR